MDLALNNQQRLICHKHKQTNKNPGKKLDKNYIRILCAVLNKS